MDREKFLAAWGDTSLTVRDIAWMFNCTAFQVRHHAIRFGAPVRPNGGCARQSADDPTPEEIEERSAVVRSWWSEETRERRMIGGTVGWMPPGTGLAH